MPFIALILLALLVAATPAAADTLATPSAPTRAATYAGTTVWSERDAGGSWHLVVDTNSNGRSARVPIAPRGVPFDVDLGPGPGAGIVAAYSRCAQEPRVLETTAPLPAYATGRGCDVYLYDFRAGSERRLEVASTNSASEFLPSVWEDDVAFGRVYENREGRLGRLPYLYVRPLGEQSARSERQPGGARGRSGLPGPMALDLYGKRLSFSWAARKRHSDGGITTLRVTTAGSDGRRLVARTGFEDSVARYLTPQATHGRVVFGLQRILDNRSLESRLYLYRLSTGALHRANAPGPIQSASRDRGSGVLIYVTSGNARDCGAGCAVLRAEEDPDYTFVGYRAVPTRERRCGDVTYTPQTDHGAFDIRAYGTTCDVARAIARDAEGRPKDFSTRGYTCEGEVHDNGLRRTETECTRGSRRVTFSRS